MEKIFLTEDVIRETIAPAKGEIWISDAAIRGFGLRVYNTTEGQRKVLCIRVRDKNGLLARRTYPIEDSDQIRLLRSSITSIEKYRAYREGLFTSEMVDMSEARTWARNQIRILKGLPTIESEDRDRRKNAKRIVQHVTLARGAQAVLANLERMKISERYRDQLSKLFFNNIPKHLQDICIPEFSPKLARELLNSMELSPGNRRTLSAFVGRIFEIALDYGVSAKHFFEARREWRRSRIAFNHPDDRDLDSNADTFKRLFVAIGRQSDYAAQSLCLRLYFETHAPLSRLMRARWEEFGVSEVKSVFTNEKKEVLIWRYSQKFGRHARFTGSIADMIVKEYWLAHKRKAPSEFCFLSQHGRSVDHIRSVQHVWQTSLNDARLPYETPREMRALYHETISYKIGLWE